MKKVGIITLKGYINYGNRLQNYALKKVLEKLDYNVETVYCLNKFEIKKNIKERLKLLKNKNKRIKYYKLKTFTKKYLNMHCFMSLKNISNKYDCFVVGSDQVWNYNFASVNKDLMLLKYSPKDKNVSYAASFGISEIRNDYKEEYQKNLSNFKYLSVREVVGKKIINDLGINDVEVNIDPTLLLSRDEWNEIIIKPKNVPSKYILLYFLGQIEDNSLKKIKKFANDNNAEIINILDEKSVYYQCGVEEFLYLEKNAFLICTDSFHSSCFAIIFNIPFIVFERKSNDQKMYSRISQLLNLFELNDSKFSGVISEKNLEHDYSKSYNILKEEQKKAKEYLKKSID